eukprot:CAMPEP_0170563580 /NCGR_PEP_ID=MMETSP0211-20121228/67557_1 /TAXON_ID=311385 /ORGANISM="Pseudokeronopsis sp., Strain OXSARD2" /LENGTH=52 /DNA_ID=CAMNT_0010881979 /DNA_START=965 /DNA_END=1123 /DNA_ORIENTATION=+
MEVNRERRNKVKEDEVKIHTNIEKYKNLRENMSKGTHDQKVMKEVARQKNAD